MSWRSPKAPKSPNKLTMPAQHKLTRPKAAFGKGQGMRRDVSKALDWACLVTGLLAVMIVVGSCWLSRFDPALMAYTFASLFVVFGITGPIPCGCNGH